MFAWTVIGRVSVALTTRPGAVREQAWISGERVRAWTWDAVPASGIPVS